MKTRAVRKNISRTIGHTKNLYIDFVSDVSKEFSKVDLDVIYRNVNRNFKGFKKSGARFLVSAEKSVRIASRQFKKSSFAKQLAKGTYFPNRINELKSWVNSTYPKVEKWANKRVNKSVRWANTQMPKVQKFVNAQLPKFQGI